MSRRAGIYGSEDYSKWTLLYLEGDQCNSVTGGWTTGQGEQGGTANMDYSWEGHRCIYVSTMDATSLAHEKPRAYAYTNLKFDLSEYDAMAIFVAKPNESETVGALLKTLEGSTPDTWHYSWKTPTPDMYGQWLYYDISERTYEGRMCLDSKGWDDAAQNYKYHSGLAIAGLALIKD